ncbi:MAG: rRNA adenine dimethyltransferase family protein, partial [Elusimicrobiota bacterium]
FFLVEIDPGLVKLLNKKYHPDGLKILNVDFLKLNLEEILPQDKSAAFIGNLPYHCATPILKKILSVENFSFAVLMFQKEVAIKIAAKPGDSGYGLLSVLVQAKSEVFNVLNVPRKNFTPVPDVDSCVLVFKKRKNLFSDEVEENKFAKLVKLAFSCRRKTILNSLLNSLPCNVAVGFSLRSKEELKKILLDCSIDPNLRPQNLNLDDFLRLLKYFKNV